MNFHSFPPPPPSFAARIHWIFSVSGQHWDNILCALCDTSMSFTVSFFFFYLFFFLGIHTDAFCSSFILFLPCQCVLNSLSIFLFPTVYTNHTVFEVCLFFSRRFCCCNISVIYICTLKFLYRIFPAPLIWCRTGFYFAQCFFISDIVFNIDILAWRGYGDWYFKRTTNGKKQ